MHFDNLNKSLDISIREIVFSVKSSHTEGYVSRRLRARIGQDAHRFYQNRTDGHTEYYIKFSLPITIEDEIWTVNIKGRVDVVHKNKKKIHIEEIKSTTMNIDTIEENETHILQLQMYSHYFMKYEDFEEISAELVVIDPVNEKLRKIKVQAEPMDQFLQTHLKKLIISHIEDEKRKEMRKQKAKFIEFPYSPYRRYQHEIVQKISKLLPKQPRIMLHAPPGIGKTITTLYPALKFSMATAKRLFIVTSKTTQQIVYVNTIRDLLDNGAQFKSIRITAKGKMCHTEQYDCYDFDCPYLANYIEFDSERVISKILELDVVERDPIEKEAEKHKICPFELSLDIAIHCDLILSDFNYIFHPRVRFQRFQNEFDNSVLIIDEAHNLVDRAADFYSEVISISQLHSGLEFIKQSSTTPTLKNKLTNHINRLIRYIQRLKDQIPNLEIDHSLVDLDRDFFEMFQDKLDRLSIQYLNSLPVPPQKKDTLIKLTDHIKYFTLLLRETDEPEFEEIYDLREQQVRIFCKSAAKKLKQQMDEFDCIIVQSATLEPLEYYKKMLGLPKDDTTILWYPNPFPKNNRLYLIEPTISTTYKERNRFLEELSQTIADVCQIKNGNYLVFFSSFEYLQRVYANLKKKIDQQHYSIIIQHSNMIDKERKFLLENLRNRNDDETNIVLAVMGGIFAEGVDYKGDMAVGSFIIGPGLPKVSFDQELKKEYFSAEYGMGFDYAYRYPGMSKVIQAAGRVFRTKQDKGFVVFMGHRFTRYKYKKLFPDDYDIVINGVIRRVRKFWQTET